MPIWPCWNRWTPERLARRFRELLDAAEAFVRVMPAGKEGLLFLHDDTPVAT